MRSSAFVVFILCLFLQGESSLAGVERKKVTHLPREVILAEQCDGYCFSTVKPSMDHFNQLKEAVEANSEMKDKINLLENQLKCKDDQIKLKDEYIQMKEDLIQMKDQLITDKVEQINSLTEQNKLKSENSNYQRERLEGKIESLEAEIIQNLGKMNTKTEKNKDFTAWVYVLETENTKCRDELIAKAKEIEESHAKINDLETQTKEFQRQVNTKTEDKKALTDRINLLETETNNRHDELIAKKKEIEVNQAKIKDLETQMKEYQGQLKTKTEDNKALTERTTVLETEANNSRDESIAKAKEIEVSQAKIKDKETEIKHYQDQLTIKDGLVKSFESTIRDKDSQFKNRTSETELLRGKYEARSCLAFVNSTDIHSIMLPGVDQFNVPCNSSVSGSGWTVIQRRVNGNVNFNRNWTDYKQGFGDLREDFFLGLEKIHQMTLAQPHEMYIQLGMVNGSTSYARFDDFKIGSEEEAYILKSVGTYSGTAGDSLTKAHLNMKFSTYDRDNDIFEYFNCAKDFGGGWWFSDCEQSYLNGKYYKDGKVSVKPSNGIHWGTWHNNDWTISLTFSQMMIRAKTL